MNLELLGTDLNAACQQLVSALPCRQKHGSKKTDGGEHLTLLDAKTS